MSITITPTGSYTIDESAGLQNATASVGIAGDSDDNDTSLALPTDFSTRLTAVAAPALIEKALSGYTGAGGNTGSNFVNITLDPGTTLGNVFFAMDSSGTPLPTYDPTETADWSSGLFTLDGVEIFLYADPVNDNIVYGVRGEETAPGSGVFVGDPDGTIVFAIYLEQTSTGAKSWTVLMEPLLHGDPTDPDDSLDLANKLYLAVEQELEFDAAGAPSGQNLFITFAGISDPTKAIVATGKEPANQSTGANITSGDTVNTSQAGGPTTFGSNNQMLVAGEGIWFTLITNPVAGLTVPDLDQTEADLESNIQFGGTFLANEASFDVVQLQGGKTTVVKISALNSTNVNQGDLYVDGVLADVGQLGDDTAVVDIDGITITGVRGKAAIPFTLVWTEAELVAGTPKDAFPSGPGGDITAIRNADGSVTLSGIAAGDNITYALEDVHNRVLVENAGSGRGADSANFDIGGFTIMSVDTGAVEVGTNIKFEDGAPTAQPQADIIIEEDDLVLNTGANPPTLSNGNNEDGSSNKHTNTIDLSDPILGVIDFGPDGKGSFALDTDVSGLPALTSKGQTIAYDVDFSDNGTPLNPADDFYTLWAFVEGDAQVPADYDPTAGASLDRLVFSWKVTVGGTATFTLYDQIDHDAEVVPTGTPAGENTKIVNLTSILQAFDREGDPANLTDVIRYVVVDDIPVQNANVVNGVVEEEHLAGGNEDQVSGPPDLDDDTADSGAGADIATTVATGSIANLVTVGADEPASFELLGTAAVLTYLDGLGLKSKGESLAYEIDTATDTLTAFVEDGTTAGFQPAEDRAIFTFALSGTNNATYTFTLLDQLDHAAPPAGTAVENTLVIDFSRAVEASDRDGDKLVLDDGSLKVTVIDDIPVQNANTSKGTVEEEHLAGGNEDTTGGSGDHLDLDTGGDFNVTTATATGSLGTLVSVGADEPASFGLVSASALTAAVVALGLTSRGDAVNTASLSGNTVTAKAGTRDIFSFALSGTNLATWTFILLDAIDHAAAGEDVKTIDLSGFVRASDFDGDSIVLDANSVTVGVIDDTPLITVDDLVGTGTPDPQIGYWSDSPGKDGEKSLAVVLDGVKVNNIAIGAADFGMTPTSGRDYTGFIKAELDGNVANGKETLNFDLTMKDDGTYVFDLLGGFGSTSTFDTSQGSLAPGGPDPVQTLLFPPAGPDGDIVFFAVKATAPPDGIGGDNNDILDLVVSGEPDRTEAQIEALPPSATLIDGTTKMNVSTAGIGVNNNNLDGNNTAGVNAGDESFVVNPETPVTKVTVFIDNSVGGYSSGEQLYYSIYTIGGAVIGPTLVSQAVLSPVTTGVAAGGKSFEIVAPGGALIDAVQLTMGLGKIKIPVIAFEVSTELVVPPIELDLTATQTDNDNDTASDGFKINLQTDPTPLANDAFVMTGTAGQPNSYNIDLALSEDEWRINDFEAGDTLVLLNPDAAVNIVTSNSGNDVITVGGRTVTVANGAAELGADEVVVAYGETILDTAVTVGPGTGGAGNDGFVVNAAGTYTGNDGADSFVFFSPAAGGANRVIADFDGSEGDQIVVSASGFADDLTPGALAAGQFVSGAGAVALDANDRFIFDTTSNVLSYDVDGVGGAGPVAIATLSDPQILVAEDILVII